MKYLKPEVFYPANHNEETDLLIENVNLNYNNNLNLIKHNLPPKLLKCYCDTDRFHDYRIKTIIYFGDAHIYKEKSDKLTIYLEYCDIELMLNFDGIVYFNFANRIDFKNIYPCKGIEEITICELDITEEGYYSLEFYSSSGGIVEVHFMKFDFRKKIKR